MRSLRWPFFLHPGAAHACTPLIHSAATRWPVLNRAGRRRLRALVAQACENVRSPARGCGLPTGARGPGELPGGAGFCGAYYLIAMPHQWNGHLVLHAHGGPALGAPGPNARRQTWSAGPSWSRPVMHGRAAAPSARAVWKCALRPRTPNACGRSLWAMWRSRAAPSCTGSRGVPAWRRGGRDVHFHNPRPAPV